VSTKRLEIDLPVQLHRGHQILVIQGRENTQGCSSVGGGSFWASFDEMHMMSKQNAHGG